MPVARSVSIKRKAEATKRAAEKKRKQVMKMAEALKKKIQKKSKSLRSKSVSKVGKMCIKGKHQVDCKTGAVLRYKRGEMVGSKLQVLKGLKHHTKGGLTIKDLKYNKDGKAVSRKASAIAKRRYAANPALQRRASAVKACAKAGVDPKRMFRKGFDPYKCISKSGKATAYSGKHIRF